MNQPANETPNPKIRVGLVEDQLLFRQGMKAILETWPDISIMFESADGFSVIKKLQEGIELPEVILLDISLPPNQGVEFSGLDVTEALQTHFPEIKILILSVHDDEYLMAQLIEKGAHGYLLKDSDPHEVYNAIVSVHSSGSYINARTLKAIQGRMGGSVKPKKITGDLTNREVEVLKLVCQQMTAEEIGAKLFISVKTVNGHRNNLLQKTGSRNVTGLVLYAIKHRIVDLL